MRAMIMVVALSLFATLSVVPAQDSIAGHASKRCGIVSKGSGDYRVRASFMSCKAARRGSVKYLRTQQPRPGFDCAPTEGGSFYCQNGRKAYWAVEL
jgi:hypothetical protein